MYGIFVLCMGYLSYVWGISLMYWGISLMYWGISLKCLEKFKITCHPGETMAARIVLCIGVLVL